MGVLIKTYLFNKSFVLKFPYIFSWLKKCDRQSYMGTGQCKASSALLDAGAQLMRQLNSRQGFINISLNPLNSPTAY